MRCEWCPDRAAKWWGVPVLGPESAMCDPCLDRVCRRTAEGFEAEKIDGVTGGRGDSGNDENNEKRQE